MHTHHLLTKVFSESFVDHLVELLELFDFGEKVVWPIGFSADRARQVIASKRQTVLD